MKIKEPILHVLESLFLGIDVELPTGDTKHTYTYHEGRIWYVTEIFRNGIEVKQGNGEDYLIDLEIPINDFIKMCNDLTESDLVGLTLEKVMRKESIKKEERRK